MVAPNAITPALRSTRDYLGVSQYGNWAASTEVLHVIVWPFLKRRWTISAPTSQAPSVSTGSGRSIPQSRQR